MRIAAQILSAALLAAVAVAQSAPASQTVQPSPQPSKVQNGVSKVKSVLKNPFKPKTDAAQTPAKPQAAAKPQTSAPAVKQPVTSQAKAAPGSKPNSSTQAKAAPANKSNAPAQAKGAPAAKHLVPVQAKVVKPARRPAVAVKIAPKPKQIAPMKKPEKVEPTPVIAQTAPKLPNPGKRDPFLSPIAAAAMRGPAPNCSTGKRCLVVDQIALKGVVQTKSGNIAMVENAARRSYYLHENDALFDGAVVKITGDSVTFRQDSSDVLGRPVSKEVVKKVSAPAV